ncbi:lipopolysaccharide biosynthesis protein [Desulfofundulus thermobenzoicus]|uniref:Lipopolysaccharide biosynthesis protein n=1 Tax=Desulfofundulus thermobenzoicus TaxID=29376 RepID=A0A6N7ITU3_9FIRM|nr:Wzz/FepE/Etk N-terminal domain-containing protein [Desulfofundulus thermobenzoicus]MQL53504.1 lipopolysaccharide biosynthesis protein [Desulfofundulus thermobenzoicus]
MAEPSPAPNAALIEEEVIDLRQYVKVLQKWRKVIALGTLLAVFTSAILSFFVLPPVYEAQTLLLVTMATDKQPVVQNPQGGLEGVVGAMSRLPILTMNTYLGQLKSEVLLQRVIDKLKLDPDLYTPRTLSGQIKATVVKDSNLIDVRVQNRDPQLAARIANALNEEYLKLLSEKNQEQMSRSVTFLKDQRAATEKELQNAVEELKKFQAQPRGVAVLEQEFKKKSEDLAGYESQLKMAGVELDQLTAGVSSLEGELSSTPKMVAVEKEDPATGKTVTMQDLNPVYTALAQKLGEKKAALAEKSAQVQGLQGVVDGLRQELDKLQAELTGKKLQQDKLQSEVDRLKQTVETLAQKTTETQIAKSVNLGDTSVVVVSDAGVPSRPIKPNKKLNIAVALVLGLLASTALAFVLEHLDYTIKTPEDVSKHLELPVVGVIPQVTPRTGRNPSYGG